MAWTAVDWENVLRTEYISGTPAVLQRRRLQMIEEAIGWDGSPATPVKHLIGRCRNGSLLMFHKPGKEAFEGTNENDMRPMIIIDGKELAPPTFSFIWSDLTNVAMADFEAFRAILLLIYRSAYLLDHRYDGNGNLRYAPSPDIMRCIHALDDLVGDRTEFKSIEGLLRFIDLLGWNEDVKYHSFGRTASFTEGRYANKTKIGRINTFLTCIRIPYEVSRFMREYNDRKGDDATKFVELYDIMQALIASRGVCTPRRRSDLFDFLSPYLVRTRPGREQLVIGSLQRRVI